MGILIAVRVVATAHRRETLCCRARSRSGSWSLNTLAHESYHLAGVRNEAQTECYALQAIDFVARRLGASSEQGRALAAFSFDQLPSRMPSL